MFRNMAGMSASDNIQLVLGYQMPFNQPELQSLTFGLLVPLKPALGISYYRTGTKELHHQQVGISTSLSFQGVNMGMRLRYWQVSIIGIKPIHAVSVDGGIQVQLTKHLSTGVLISNLTHSSLANTEILPLAWFTGLNYKASPELSVMMEFGQTLGSSWQYRMGVEYVLKKRFFTRTGYSISSRRGYFGLGFKLTRLQVDYALDIHQRLGITHQAGLSYCWQ